MQSLTKLPETVFSIRGSHIGGGWDKLKGTNFRHRAFLPAHRACAREESLIFLHYMHHRNHATYELHSGKN